MSSAENLQTARRRQKDNVQDTETVDTKGDQSTLNITEEAKPVVVCYFSCLTHKCSNRMCDLCSFVF